MEAEMWFSELVTSLANVMPDVNRKELPACLTMQKVYEMYIEATESGPNATSLSKEHSFGECGKIVFLK